MENKTQNKHGQVAIFIILAIIIVSAIILGVIFKDSLFTQKIPAEFEPVYNYYLSCIENDMQTGALILEQQAGYIQQPDFTPGSEYMPFSNQLDFLGTGVPYWYYISGNGVVKEQIPSKEKMQEELNQFVDEENINCNFEDYEQRGFEISLGNIETETLIQDNSITAEISQPLSITFENTTWTSKKHNIKINTQLGKFYNLAKEIYYNEKQIMFLENQGVDILRLYAPVDGSEVGCSTKLWQVNQIRQDLINALTVNIPELKIKGDYYTLNAPENKYFVKDIGKETDTNVNFMFSNQWPMKIEVWPSEDDIIRAEPVGLQEGLGMLGFCYTPYHFVYDFAYPVLIQIYSPTEIFQFPVVVYINKNQPRESLDAESVPNVVPELCQNKISEQTVNTYSTQLSHLETTIKFKCFDTTCSIGQTEKGILKANFPQCANGYIVASSEGYETKKYLASTISSNQHTIILDKKYKLNLEITEGLAEADYAVITFTKDPDKETKTSRTIAYPEQKGIELSEGQYQITAYFYTNSTIELEGGEKQQCTKVPRAGILGIFGLTEEKCFTINIPKQTISYTISGGGKQMHYITETELKNSNTMEINSEAFTTPRNAQQLQENYNRLETEGLDIIIS